MADRSFPLGSVTKTFTSLLLLDAVERGEVGIDDPVQSRLGNAIEIPQFSGQSITLFHLASQSSGLPFHMHANARIVDAKTGKLDLRKFKKLVESVSRDEFDRFVSAYRLNSKPGTGFQYSNVGMSLLGHTLEKTTGKSYEKLVRERICNPLKMRDTCQTLSREQTRRLVVGHLEDHSKAGHWNLKVMVAAGGLFSTANDMLGFLKAQIGVTDRNGLAESIKRSHQMQFQNDPRMGNTAIPWYDNGVYQPRKSRFLGHSGHGYGGFAFVAFDKINRRGVVILTNQLRVFPNPIGWTILQGMPFTKENIASAVRRVIGVGISLKQDNESGKIMIDKVFSDSPAGRAGVLPGAVIQSINGKSVAGATIEKCLEMMPGKAGTLVVLVLKTKNEETEYRLRKSAFLTATGLLNSNDQIQRPATSPSKTKVKRIRGDAF